MKFTQYAKPQVIMFSVMLLGEIMTVILLAVLLGCFVGGWIAPFVTIAYAVFAIPIAAFLLAFFRDPDRKADHEKIPGHVLVAPADGTVTEIKNIDDPRVGGPAVKIGIFLSIFNVHINRAPCLARVADVTYKSGEFLDARDLDSSHRNEANDLVLEPQEAHLHNLPFKLVVRQIAGKIARRIVCEAKPGTVLNAGQRYGMIKFGSRTELIVPASPAPKILVQLHQKVRAGNDFLVSY